MSEKLRRNGNRPACEPCRKSKLRCDHGRPPCGRCIRRGFTAEQCHYHPAPMTQPKPSPQINQTPDRVAILTPTSTIHEPPSTTASQPDELDLATGLVGMRGSLMAFDDLAGSSSDRAYVALTRNGVAVATRPPLVTEEKITEAARLLEQLFTITFTYSTEELTAWQDEYIACTLGDGILVRPAWDAAFQTLESLKPNPTRQQFLALSRRTFSQTASMFVFPPSLGPGGIASLLAGNLLRWETVSLFAHVLGVSFASVSENASSTKFRELAHRMLSISIQCKDFCQQLGQINDLSVWMTFKLPLLHTWCHGDDSYSSWQGAGDVVSMLYALNWHKGVADSPTTPAYVVELRRRVVALAHEGDKQGAIFVGRPPRLTRQYCVPELPLDLPDEVILGPPEEFERAKSALKMDGWDTGNVLHPASRVRAGLLLASIREEILELSLSTRPTTIVQQANAILDRLMALWASCPLSKYSTGNLEGLSGATITIVGWMYMEFLYTRFLLLKMLVSHSDRNRIEMIQVSHELLSEVLAVMRGCYGIVYSRPDREFIVVFYAMPAASILLLELYRLTRQPRPGFVLNRSTIIKDIGALIAWCDWFTSPGQGNFELCKRAQAIFSKGLDCILDLSYAAPESRNNLHDEANAPDQLAMDASNIALTNDFAQDPAWAAWLESFGLEGNHWLDFTIDDSLMGNPDTMIS